MPQIGPNKQSIARRLSRRLKREYARWKYSRYDVRILLSEEGAVQFIRDCIRDARRECSKLLIPPGGQILSLNGMSSDKNRHLLNNLCSLQGARYLEIGVWQGSTFTSAGYRNQIKMTAVDNWSQFDGPKETFRRNCLAHVQNEKTLFDTDCFTIRLKELPGKYHLYFYDGHHSYESQYQAFRYFDPVLESVFIAIVDDYNNDAVQRGTQDAFRDLGYTVVFEKYLPSRGNGDMSSWWNGFYVALVRKNDIRQEDGSSNNRSQGTA